VVFPRPLVLASYEAATFADYAAFILQVIVTGLPTSASWQDLKDHMRQAGDVCYTDVDHRWEPEH
jgi:hypothetical protein